MKRHISVGVVSLFLMALVLNPGTLQATRHGSTPGSDQGQTSQERGQQPDNTGQQGETAQEDAQQRQERIQQQVQERRAEVQQQVCERKEDQLQQVIPRLATQSRALKDAIDQVYDNVQGFVENEQVVVEDYEAHTESIDAAQADAEAAVQVVENYEFELDCENPNIGQQLDGFRLAVEEARQELKTYRDELVKLIQEMRAEEASNSETSNDNDQNGNGAGNAASEEVENAQ